jgi:hypothetical protein
MGMMAPDAPIDPYAEPQKFISKPKKFKSGTYVRKADNKGFAKDQVGRHDVFEEVKPTKDAFGRAVAPAGAILIDDNTYSRKNAMGFNAVGGRDSREDGAAMMPMDYSEKVINPEWNKWFNYNLSLKPKTKAKDVQSGGGTGRPSNRKRAGSGTILTDPLGATTVLGG